MKFSQNFEIRKLILTMSLELCFDQLPHLTSKQLYQLQAKIQEEFQARANRKYQDVLKEWSGENRTVKYMTVNSKQGWIAIIGVFEGTSNEMFRVIHQDKDQAKELVAKQAIENSAIIDLSEPMSID